MLVLFVLVTIASFAQTPQGFNYQSVIRDASDVVLANQSVGLQFKLLQGSTSGTLVYTETHNTTTTNLKYKYTHLLMCTIFINKIIN